MSTTAREPKMPPGVNQRHVYKAWLREVLKLRLGVFAAFRGKSSLETNCERCKKTCSYLTSGGKRFRSGFYRSLLEDSDFCDPNYIPDMKDRLAEMERPERVRDDHRLVIVDARYKVFMGHLVHILDLKKFLKSYHKKKAKEADETKETMETKEADETKETMETKEADETKETMETKEFLDLFSEWFSDLEISKEDITIKMVFDLLADPLFKIRVLHYKHFFREISLNNVSRRLGNSPTRRSIETYKLNLNGWFDSGPFFQLEMIWKTLPSVVKEAIRGTIEKIIEILNLEKLDIALFLHKSPGVAKKIDTLCTIEERLMTKNHLSELYHPETKGIKGDERKITKKYKSYVQLGWDDRVDLDLHVVYTTKDGKKHVDYDTPSQAGCNLDHDNMSGGLGSTEIISFDTGRLLKLGAVKITAYVLCYTNRGLKSDVKFTVNVVSNGKENKYTGRYDPQKHKCGDDPTITGMVCFSKNIFLSENERKILPPNMARLPQCVTFLQEVSSLSQVDIKKRIVVAGKGQPVYVYLNTPNVHFQNPKTLYRLPGHQVTTSVTTNVAHEDGTRRTVCVGRIKQSEVGYILLKQVDFKRNTASVEHFKKFYKKKVFSPFMSERIRLIMEVLHKKNLNEVSNVILSYTSFVDIEIPLFTTIGRITSGSNWWNS